MPANQSTLILDSSLSQRVNCLLIFCFSLSQAVAMSFYIHMFY